MPPPGLPPNIPHWWGDPWDQTLEDPDRVVRPPAPPHKCSLAGQQRTCEVSHAGAYLAVNLKPGTPYRFVALAWSNHSLLDPGVGAAGGQWVAGLPSEPYYTAGDPLDLLEEAP